MLSRTDKNGKVLIISLYDDDNFIQLSGFMAEVWNRIDGKRKWREILKADSTHFYDSQPIYKFITKTIKQETFSGEEIRTEGIEWERIDYDAISENLGLELMAGDGLDGFSGTYNSNLGD